MSINSSETLDLHQENDTQTDTGNITEENTDIFDIKETFVQNNIDENSLEKIIELHEKLSKQVADMEILFNKRIMHTDYEDKIIDRMHAELQKYKEDLYSQLIRPVLLDIIEVRDSIIRISDIYLEKPEGEQDIPNKIFSGYAFDLQDILEKNNVTVYRSKCGDLFAPVNQRVVKKEITHDEVLHGKIAESLSCGYSYAGRVISAEKVSVYFYEKLDEKESEDNLNG